MKILLIYLLLVLIGLLLAFIARLFLRLRKIQISNKSIFYQMNKSLKSVLEQQEAMLDVIPDLIWIKDGEGKFLVVNKAFQKFFGLKSLDIVGKIDHDIFDTELADKYYQDDCELMRTKKRQIFEDELVGKNRKMTTETIKTPILNYVGKIVGTLGIAHDITQRKKDAATLEIYRQELEALLAKKTKEVEDVNISLDEHVKEHISVEVALKESEQKFEALLEKMAEGFIVVDTKQKILFANEKFCQMIEYPKKEVVGHDAKEFVVGNADTIIDKEITKRKTGTNVAYEISFKTKTGKKIDVLVSPTGLFKDDKFIGSTCVLLDLTQFKKNERELKRSNESLEQFAFVASHDLQEPLRMITSYLTLLSKRSETGLDEKSNEYLGHAIDSANYMHVLIKDLLEYSRIKKGGKKM